jgi:hypothetical protein
VFVLPFLVPLVVRLVSLVVFRLVSFGACRFSLSPRGMSDLGSCMGPPFLAVKPIVSHRWGGWTIEAEAPLAEADS